ncbi:hypothetical protein [uncultured Clostridium sp.]|uniref:hypothetical protein n=1 Tax=uncultured Clostridium sp. TaxID=59620 RepID=UPI0026192589|nr:hypothetical protein [uncultured Clostridium sp.]
MKVKCDICDVEFELDKEKIKKKYVDGIEVNYFECIKCGHKYITACYDDYILREQKKLNKLVANINKAANEKEREELLDKYTKKLKHLNTHSNRLKMDIEKRWIIQG